MDLAFNPEEEFRQEVRTWMHASLPTDTAHKVRHGLRLSRDDVPGIASGEVWPGQSYNEPSSGLEARMSSTASLLTKLGALAFR